MPEKSVLPSVWQVPREFRNRLGDTAGRQRAMLAEGHLLLVMHCPPLSDEENRKGRFFWRKPDGTWSSSDFGGGIQAIDEHLAEYERLLDHYDAVENAAVSAKDYFQVLRGLSPLHRSAKNMHQTLQDARQMLPDDRDLINFRDRAYAIERSADLLYNGAKNALDFAIARRSEEQAENSQRMTVSAHRLNVLAAFFFPLATLMTVFGANLRHGLEDADPPMAFVAVLAAGVLGGFVLRSYVTQPPKRTPSEPGRPAAAAAIRDKTRGLQS